MASRLALPLLLLLLLLVGAWVMFGGPSDPTPVDPEVGNGNGQSGIEAGQLEGSGTGSGDPRRTDLTGPEGDEPGGAAAREAALALASFHGQVTDDQGKPIPEVEVLAFGLVGWATGFDGDPSKLAASWQATTDADGYFAFPETPRDGLRFLLEFHHPAFSSAELTNLPATVGRSRNLGVVVLGPGFRIDGTVFDAFGNPQAEAEVLPYRDTTRFNFSNLNADPRPLSEPAVTDAEGRFSLAGLPARQVRLKASAAGQHEAWSSAVIGRHGDHVEDMEIHLGEAREIFGIVLDTNRRPIPGARVVADMKSTGFAGRDRNRAETVSLEDGRFTLGLPQASEGIFLTVGAEGFWIGQRDLDREPAEGAVEMLLEPIPTLQGLVLDEDGRAVPGATVRLVENRQGQVNPKDMPANVETLSAEDGTFRLVPNLRDAWGGRFTVHAWDETHAVGSSEMFRLREAQRFKEPDLRITLGTGYSAYGTVVDPSGEALGGTRVHLRSLVKPRRNPFGMEPGAQRGGDIHAHTTSAADGSFRFDGLAPGDYRLEAYHGGYSPAESEDFGLVDSDYVARLQLVEACGIDGIVTGPIGDFRSLRVTASSPGLDLLDARVDAEGRFRFTELMPGTWNLRLQDGEQDESGSSFLWGNAEPLARLDGLEVPAGNTVPATLELDLTGRGSVSGTVRVNGEPAGDYSVFVLPQATGAAGGEDIFGGRNLARQLRVATTDFAGRYSLAGIQSSDYWVLLCRPGAFPSNLNFAMGSDLPNGLARSEVLLRDGAAEVVDFDVQLGSLALEISNPREGRTSMARLLPDPEDGRRSYSFYLRSQGYTFDHLPAGRYLMQLKLQGDWVSTTVDVTAGSVRSLPIELPTAGSGGKATMGEGGVKPPR